MFITPGITELEILIALNEQLAEVWDPWAEILPMTYLGTFSLWADFFIDNLMPLE